MKDKQRHTLMCEPTHAHISKIGSTNEPEKKQGMRDLRDAY